MFRSTKQGKETAIICKEIQKGVQDEIKKVGNNDFSVQFPGIFR